VNEKHNVKHRTFKVRDQVKDKWISKQAVN